MERFSLSQQETLQTLSTILTQDKDTVRINNQEVCCPKWYISSMSLDSTIINILH